MAVNYVKTGHHELRTCCGAQRPQYLYQALESGSEDYVVLARDEGSGDYVRRGSRLDLLVYTDEDYVDKVNDICSDSGIAVTLEGAAVS